ncbi:hypothetical protein C4569_03385 [Candidatus Parcubacteria bacterium]|nr:MAG: hypothetical protein C4569_03385 [Candidatus Parcubacteria bacterium]
MNKNFPNLKIIEIEKAVLHEETDLARVRRYKKMIQKDGYLLDPPIVASLTKGKFVVLDGANRVSVFKELHIPHIMVQQVKYKKPDVILETWNHIICDKDYKKFHGIKKFKKFQIKEMIDFVNSYNGKFYFHRVIGTDIKKIRKHYPNICCLAIFPKLKPKDILNFANQGRKIPSGISRHIIAGRALFVKMPLSFFRKKITAAEKNKIFQKYIHDRFKSNMVRYYAEPLFIFN